MGQPIKKILTNKKSKKTTSQKKKQDTKSDTITVSENNKRLPENTKGMKKKVRKHKEYGTSKLEEKFAKNFLEKLGVNYIYQFKAESIGRYYDFYLPENNILIEIDGDFFHGFGLVYEEKSPMQKKNSRVDKDKDHWAVANGIPLIRIWEHDINEHPEKVMAMLKDNIAIYSKKKEIMDNKNKRH